MPKPRSTISAFPKCVRKIKAQSPIIICTEEALGTVRISSDFFEHHREPLACLEIHWTFPVQFPVFKSFLQSFQKRMESILALESRCRVATPSDTVLHSECAFTFHSPFTTDRGIVVNLNSFIGTIQELAFSNVSEEKDIFLRIVKKRVEKVISEPDAPTKLAIGVEGGFATDDDKFDTLSTYSVVVLENSGKEVAEILYDETSKESFPESVVKSVESVIHHVGLAIQQDLTAWQDDEEIPISKYAEGLPFIENGVTISPDPKSWKCEKSGDAENLWLNLSDGFIGGGRKNVSTLIFASKR